ncbi:MAG: polyphenol oxidase family protein [Phycisphaerae bacterium]
MRFLDVDGRRYVQFDSLRRQQGLAHAFSTRPFDVSVRNARRAAECATRRRQMALDFGFPPEYLCCCMQVHEARVALVTEAQGQQRLEGFDAVATDVPSVPLMTFSADCPLVLVYDAVRRVVGLAHASWRCTVAAVTRRLVETMQQRFSREPKNLMAGVGPSVGPRQYEVNEDVYRAAAELPDHERLFHVRRGRLYFDLREDNRSQLEGAGLRRENVEIAGICTMSRTDLFYSYRREGTSCGHFGLLAGLR